MAKHREYILEEEPAAQISEAEHPGFYANIKLAVLFSLEKKGLLTHSQYERGKELVEQYNRKKGSRA